MFKLKFSMCTKPNELKFKKTKSYVIKQFLQYYKEYESCETKRDGNE